MTIDRFIPNSFQISNEFVDSLMDELSGNAVKCYLKIVRKTRGWGKESDAIAISQFIDGKKLKDARTVNAALSELEEAGLIQKHEFPGRPNVFSLATPTTKNVPPSKIVPTTKNVPTTKIVPTTKNVHTPPSKIVPTTPLKNCTPQKTIENKENKEERETEISEAAEIANPININIGDFAITDDWEPEDKKAFNAKLRRSQIPSLEDKRIKDALIEFTGYWGARGDMQTQAMWEHKFFQSLTRLKARGELGAVRQDPAHKRLDVRTADGMPVVKKSSGLRPLGKF